VCERDGVCVRDEGSLRVCALVYPYCASMRARESECYVRERAHTRTENYICGKVCVHTTLSRNSVSSMSHIHTHIHILTHNHTHTPRYTYTNTQVNMLLKVCVQMCVHTTSGAEERKLHVSEILVRHAPCNVSLRFFEV